MAWRDMALPSVGRVVSQMRLLLHLPLDALAPPGRPQANLLGLQDEALGLHHVEEELPDQVRRPVARHFETCPKPVNRESAV